ncbi:MAG: hypothetical protein P1P90_03605 [Patescibacteria group bacterium]|nr:hypothetical protein [Patescibacteria group bacterium]
MKNKIFQIFLAVTVIAIPVIALASTSTNYEGSKEHGGPVNFDGTSANYEFKAEVGHPGAGVSTSTNYEVFHGTFWEDVTSTMSVTIQWAVPEMRVGATSTNDDAIFYLTFRTSQNTDDVIVFEMPNLATTSNDGTYANPIIISGLTPGTYDVGIKTHQHITKILQDIFLTDTTNTVLNFSQIDNSAPFGDVRLLAGDVSGATSTPATMGDDVVNSVDLSIIINELDNDDLTGNDIRSNLNQDTVINSVDLSLMLKNLDLEGEN